MFEEKRVEKENLSVNGRVEKERQDKFVGGERVLTIGKGRQVCGFSGAIHSTQREQDFGREWLHIFSWTGGRVL